MSEAGDKYGPRFWHEVRQWTVGELRAAMEGLPDDMTVRVEVAYSPSTGDPDAWGRDQFVVTRAAVDDSEHLRKDEFLIRVDYSTGSYLRKL